MKPPKKKFVYHLDTVFKFGKHEGSTLRDIIINDPSYIEWCLSEIEDFEITPAANKMYIDYLIIHEDFEEENHMDSFYFCD